MRKKEGKFNANQNLAKNQKYLQTLKTTEAIVLKQY